MAKNRKAEVDAAQKNIDLGANRYQLKFETSAGEILIDLYPDLAPGHVKNIVALAQIGYYDGIVFHRVIPGFMIQAGCPDGNGTGGPGYTIDAEFSPTLHEAGTLSMARTSNPNSAGSQFFLCLGRVPHLDRQYTVFGKTADDASLQTVLKIGAVPTDAGDRPKTPVTINKGSVIVTPLEEAVHGK